MCQLGWHMGYLYINVYLAEHYCKCACEGVSEWDCLNEDWVKQPAFPNVNGPDPICCRPE